MKEFKNKKETEFEGNNNFSGEKKESGTDKEILPAEKYKSKNRKIIFLLGAAALLFIVTVGIYLFYKQPSSPPGKKPSSQTEEKNVLSDSLQEKLSKQSKLQKFSSYEDMKNYLASLSEMEMQGFLGMSQMTDLKNVGDSGFSATQRETAAPEGLEEGADYSATNIQVEGVDEADIIKTDGKYIYAVSQKDLYIAEAFPAQEAKVLSKIEFEDLPQDIYINDNKLVIFGNDTQVFIQNEATAKEAMPNPHPDSSYVFFKVFDISDKKNPSQIRDLKFEGNYFNSRMIGDQVYFLTSKYARYHDANFLLPKILENGKEVYNLSGKQCQNCPPVYYAEIPYNNYSFVNIAAINLDETDKKPENQVYLLPSTQNMYVSQNNIYITYTKRLNQSEIMLEVMFDVMYPKLSPEDKEKADKIMSADKDILNQQEKAEKITRIFEKYGLGLSKERASNLQKEIQDEIAKKMDWISREIEKTVVHKINIANGELNYKGSGEVTGTVLNQFSMDEKGDYFRIATTRNQQWLGMWGIIRREEKQQESFNNLYVLDEDLKIAGSLEGLAQDEKIYSVRFMQDRAYMVTFKQIDPLFVIDLKNPENPKVLGKLKIPGFSNYLHPYNENLLIGLGRETEENEHGGVVTKGLKLSLFDVSDVSQPKEIDKYIFQDKSTSSIAQNEHKAFLFSKEKNLLAFPISVSQPVFINNVRQDMEIAPMPASNYFRGAAIFQVNEKGFELKGLIDHSEGEGVFQKNNYGRHYYSNTIQRILYIENVLYTFSNNYLQLNALSDLSEIKKMDLQKSLEEDHRVIN